jgi:hypothetical protein
MRKIYVLIIGFVYFAHPGGAQNVGIGTPTPAAKLHVAGAYAASTYAAHPNGMQDVDIANNYSTFHILEGGGAGDINVTYLGTPADGQRLVIYNDDVDDAALFNGYRIPHGGGMAVFVYVGGGWRMASVYPTTDSWLTTGNDGIDPAFNYIGTNEPVDLSLRTNGAEHMRITNSGRVGIGTATPTEKLDVVGNVRFSGALMPNGNAGTIGKSLISQGPGVPPIWASATQGQRFSTVFSTGGVTLAPGGNALIPGLTQTIIVPSDGSTYDFYIYTDGAAQLQNFVTTNIGVQAAIIINVNNVMQRAITTIIDNTSNLGGGIRSFVSSYYISDIPPGTYTVEVRSQNMGPTHSYTIGAAYAPGSFLVCSLTVGLIKK